MIEEIGNITAIEALGENPEARDIVEEKQCDRVGELNTVLEGRDGIYG